MIMARSRVRRLGIGLGGVPPVKLEPRDATIVL